jgi:DNA-binding IclR family transcriptional regulator
MTGAETTKPKGQNAEARVPALTLAKGLGVLSRVAKGDNTLGKMSKALDMNKATVHRLATTLLENDFLSYSQRDGYALGAKCLELGFVAHQQITLTRISHDHLRQLSADTGDTVNLGILDRDQVHYVDSLPGTRKVEVRCTVGERQPLRRTGLGKALLLDEPEDRLRDIYQREALLHPRYRYDIKQWLEIMGQYRAEQYALDLDENDEHVRCVAAPIRDKSGRIIAAVSVSSAAQYMDDARVQLIKGYVKETAANISHQCGYGG